MYYITLSLNAMPLFTILQPYNDYTQACKDAQLYCNIDTHHFSFSISNPLKTIII